MPNTKWDPGCAYLESGGDGGEGDCELGSTCGLVLGQGLLVHRELDGIGCGPSPQVVHASLQPSLIHRPSEGFSQQALPCLTPTAEESMTKLSKWSVCWVLCAISSLDAVSDLGVLSGWGTLVYCFLNLCGFTHLQPSNCITRWQHTINLGNMTWTSFVICNHSKFWPPLPKRCS